MKNINKFAGIMVGAIFIIFAANMTGVAGSVSGVYGTGTDFRVKFSEYDINVGYPKYIVNIDTSEKGHIKYLENYYSIDGNGNKKFYSGSIYYDKDIDNNGNITFEMYRPKSRSGATFSQIEMVVIINNDTVLTKWRDLHKTRRWGYIPVVENKSVILSDVENDHMKNISKNISNRIIIRIKNSTKTNKSLCLEEKDSKRLGLFDIIILTLNPEIGQNNITGMTNHSSSMTNHSSRKNVTKLGLFGLIMLNNETKINVTNGHAFYIQGDVDKKINKSSSNSTCLEANSKKSSGLDIYTMMISVIAIISMVVWSVKRNNIQK